MAALGRLWEWAKAIGVVLWPIRFILLIMLAMVAILSVPQAQDALYGAVVERTRWFGVFVAVTAWAAQTWYWSRFLYGLPLRKFSTPLYYSKPFGAAFAAPLITWTPRLLGALVFVIIGIFILAAGGVALRTLAWTGLYALSGTVFLGLTIARRKLLVGARRPELKILPGTVAHSPLGVALSAIWFVLLLLASATALTHFSADARLDLAVAIVAMFGVTGATVLLKLSLPKSTKLFVGALTLLNLTLFLLSIFDAPATGARLGPAVVLMLAAGIWVGASSFFLVFPGERYRIPVTSLLFAVMLVFGYAPKIPVLLFGAAGDFDNHQVRLLAPLLTTGDPKRDERADLFAAFEAWRAQAPCLSYAKQPCRHPMVLVAAQGGASRSGYWVATVLGALEDAVTNFPFHRVVFAISGVSGGSLGGAVYQRLVERRRSGLTPLCQGPDGDQFSVCGQQVMRQDFLGPDFFSLFNADLLQRLLPGDVMPDRAEVLEQAWERAWRNAVGSDDFAEPFHIRSAAELDAKDRHDWLPVLFLNGASVKTGRRIVTADIAVEPKCRSSDLLFTGAELPSAVDFFCLTRRQIRLSTAVHNSARFPYISPVGTLWATNRDGRTWKADKIADGGYVEAQGATTLNDLLQALDAEWQRAGYSGRWDDTVMPIVISIQNDPPQGGPDCAQARTTDVACLADTMAKTIGDEASTMGFGMQIANEFLAPPIGLADSRSGRGAYAARALAVRLYYQGLNRRPDARTDGWSAYSFNLRETQGPAPAMSWYLSHRSQRDMAIDLCPAANAPSTNLDVGLRQLGQELNVPDLRERIRDGKGCMALRAQVAIAP